VTLNPDVIRSRASEIEDSIARLERFATLPVDDFVSSQDATDIACYRLVVAIEAALAMCYHVAARRFRKAPEDYSACFAVLRDADLLPAALTERLQRMARFRNLLVHMYGRVDHRRVHAIIQHDLQDLRAFVAAVVRLLQQPPDDTAPPAAAGAE
jgi:uncharacterized protein YutE (UPF0331/DUF86 family)